ncbi:MAG: hypothetical protein AAF410_03290 [Pseudomonadota bacterium]
MRELTLFIPGLLGPDAPIQADELPELPALNWLLGRAEQQSIHTLSACTHLCELFGLGQNNGTDLPIAAISRLSDDNQPPSGHWLRADPVHVSVDRDGLILLDSTRFNLSQHDALALAAEVNRLLDEKGMALEVPNPYRWYLKLPEPQQLKTTPIDMVVGKDVLRYMPTGDDRVTWIQLLNEIQMILHASEINVQRENQKQLPVNSLWLWGIGGLPDSLKRKWSRVYSNDMLARGLSMLAATPYDELQNKLPDMDNLSDDFQILISFQQLQKYNYYLDMEGWFEELIKLENKYLAPLKRMIMRRKFDKVILQTDKLTFTLNKNAGFQFWKSNQNLISIRHTS